MCHVVKLMVLVFPTWLLFRELRKMAIEKREKGLTKALWTKKQILEFLFTPKAERRFYTVVNSYVGQGWGTGKAQRTALIA